MEGLQNWVRSFSNDSKSESPSFFAEISNNLRSGGGQSAGASFDSSRVLATRPNRYLLFISINLTHSFLMEFFFDLQATSVAVDLFKTVCD